MGQILKIRGRFCVAHSNGMVIVRKGRRACTKNRALAKKDKANMECRNMGACPPGTSRKALL